MVPEGVWVWEPLGEARCVLGQNGHPGESLALLGRGRDSFEMEVRPKLKFQEWLRRILKIGKHIGME